MLISIAILFAALTLLNYRTCHDARYPPFLASGIWLTVLVFYGLSPIPVYSISMVTSLVFVVALLAFTGGGQLALALSSPGTRTSEKTPVASSWRPRLKVLLLLISVVLLPFLFTKANLLADQSGLENWFIGLRVELTSSDSLSYGFLGNAAALSYFTTFIYAIEHGDELREKLQYYLSVLISFAYALLSTGRTPFLLVLITLMGIAAMRNRLGPKKIFVSTIVFVGAFAVFALILGKGGDLAASVSDNVSSVEESFAQYAIGAIPAFDQVVKRDAPLDYGKNTFLDGLNLLRRATGGRAISPIQEEVSVPFPTNVYTAIQPPFKDFGIIGVVLAFGVIGALSTYFFLRALSGDSLNIFCYSLSLYPLFLMAFTDQYFAPMLSWVKYLIAAYLYFGFGKRRRVNEWA